MLAMSKKLEAARKASIRKIIESGKVSQFDFSEFDVTFEKERERLSAKEDSKSLGRFGP